jgi:hypothetical protein
MNALKSPWSVSLIHVGLKAIVSEALSISIIRADVANINTLLIPYHYSILCINLLLLFTCALPLILLRFSVTSQASEFMAMPLDMKTHLKWKLLLERCAARILVLNPSLDHPRPLITLLSCTVADPSEAVACIPVY